MTKLKGKILNLYTGDRLIDASIYWVRRYLTSQRCTSKTSTERSADSSHVTPDARNDESITEILERFLPEKNETARHHPPPDALSAEKLFV